MKIYQCCFCIIFLICGSYSFAQVPSVYPQNYFRDPLDIPIQLSANFGDLRSNHFHMGLDIRTQGRENLYVHAAADGYISRIKIEKWGYGKAIYITHPNGFTTLYAHLNTFYEALENYIEDKQYKDQQWAQDIDIPAGLFPVTKGQFIALSGNTGGSAGPHLHFEIRDTKTDNNLNPELFGFNIPDNAAPVIYGLYWYDRRYSTYLAEAKSIPVKAAGNTYNTVSKIVKVGSPLLSLGIRTMDKYSGSPFRFGIYQSELWMDDSLLHAFQLNNFSYDDTRYINACIDYTRYMKDGVFVQHLATLPGNKLNIFSEAGGSGVIILSDTIAHKINIAVKDIHGNTSRIEFFIQYDKNLERQLPTQVNAAALVPGHPGEINTANARAKFSALSFYDTLSLVLMEQASAKPNAASALIGIHNYFVPVHDSFSIALKTTLPAVQYLRSRVVMQLQSNRHKEIAKPIWNGDWASAKFNRLGFVQLLIDTIPPAIKAIGWQSGTKFTTQKTLRLRCTDELDEIATFNAELDGQWLLFAEKNDDFIYTFDDHCPRGLHTLVVTVIDKAGNTTEQRFKFTR